MPRSFYDRSALEVAPALVGHLLVRLDESMPLVGRIVETEAYTADDPSSHSFRGISARNASMFGPPGHAYVYKIYGYHFCLNFVTGPVGAGEAVLVRALEPLEGIEIMQRRRTADTVEKIASGPGKLCQAFGIDRTFDGADLVEGNVLRVAEGPGPSGPIETRRRIGLSHREASLYSWRFVEAGSRFLSRR